MDILLENKVFTIENFLSPRECVDFKDRIANKQQTANFTNAGKFKNDKYVDDILAQKFYQKIRVVLGEELSNSLKMVRANRLIMTGMYKPGQHFNLHTDTGLYYNRKDNQASKFTLLIYLNDNYEGGETAFFNDDFENLFDVKPKMGKALLFNIDMWHKGNEVLSGEKYWVGCEIICDYIT